VDDPHATTAAAESSFDDQRESDFVGGLNGLFAVLDRLVGAGQRGDIELLGDVPGGDLVAHEIQQVGVRPDENDSSLLTCASKPGVLGKESIPRMNHVNLAFLRQCDDTVNVQIGAHGPFAFADQVGFIGLETVNTQPIFLRVNRHGSQAQLGGSPKNADGDFTSIGDEKLRCFLLRECGRFFF
jgi:hypothetical protein